MSKNAMQLQASMGMLEQYVEMNCFTFPDSGGLILATLSIKFHSYTCHR